MAPLQLKQEAPDAKPVLEYTSRAELIRRLKRRIATSDSATNNQEAESDLVSSPAIATGTQETFAIKEVQILGSTVFKKSEIAEIVKPYIGRQARFEELLERRSSRRY